MAHHHVAEGQAAVGGDPAGVQVAHEAEDGLAAGQRIQGHDHDLVADVLHHPPPGDGGDVEGAGLQAGDDRQQLTDGQLLGQGGEAHEVDEADGQPHEGPLPKSGLGLPLTGDGGPQVVGEQRPHGAADDQVECVHIPA